MRFTLLLVISGLQINPLRGSSISPPTKPEVVEAVIGLAQSSLGNGLHGLAQKSKDEAIEAILALAKHSLVNGGQDNVDILKNALTLLSELKGEDRFDAAMVELLTTALGVMDDTVPHQCTASEAGKLLPNIVYRKFSRSSFSLRSCCFAESVFVNYADRHIHRLEEVVQDYDCMEREFDVSDPDFDPVEAATVLGKCRLLVLRNVFPKTLMEEYRQKYDDYVYAIHTGKIDRFNTKTTDLRTGDIVQGRCRKRHDITLPKWLKGKEFTTNPDVLEILRDDQVLGPDMFHNLLGSVISEPGAPSMNWHEDTSHIWSRDTLEVSGLAGHDLPPYAISLFVPLFANVTHDHGPTEFCVGSSHLDGFPVEVPAVMDETLVEEGSTFAKMASFRDGADLAACPPEHWRAPLVNMGDAILFDYQITHRGGANKSPESRALIYAMYSRFWFRDGNFDETQDEESEESADNDKFRYALIDESTVEHVPEATSVVASLQNFAGMLTADDSTTEEVEFYITNIDVEGAIISIDDDLQEEIAPKEQWLLTGKAGSTLWAHDRDGNVIDSWKVATDQGETILVQ